MKNFKGWIFPFFGQDEKGKNFEPVGGSGQLVDPIDDS